ncbi:MAG: proton-conducting transporter membrane subunit [Bacillota bacterium]
MTGSVSDNIINSSLPLAIVLIPIISSALVPLTGYLHYRYRNALVLFVTAFSLVLSGYLSYLVWQVDVISKFSLGFGEFPLFFRVDRLGAVFNLITALIWFLASIFSLSYMTHEKRHSRYYTFYLLTLGGCLGVFLAADLFSLLLFFELMSLASYLLVIHTQTNEAMKAGKQYLFLGVFGGLCILAATIMVYWYIGTVEITPMLEQLVLIPVRTLVAALFVIGFGIKAGMVPLHIWLPKAHPVAPSPASALLSGIMIKTGAYGIARVATVLYTPSEPGFSEMGAYTEHLGFVLIWLGVITMTTGAFIALFQNNAKRLLAYSSISQMGYIIMGIGTIAYLGFDGPMAMGGFSWHVINHAFFKAGMFMMVGAIYFHTGEIELKRMGGLWRTFPVTAVVFLIAAMGIAGIPGFNGYTSKVMLHHALVEAYEHHDSYLLYLAERMFILTGTITTCYIARLFSSIFLGKKPEGLPTIQRERWNERLVFIVIGSAILFIGTNPFLMLKEIIGPLVQSFPFDEYYFNYMMELNFWDRHDLEVMGAITAGAAVIFVLGNRFELFTRKLPYWLSIEYLLYQPVVCTFSYLYVCSGRALENAVDSAYIQSPRLLAYFCIGGKMIDRTAESVLVGTMQPLKMCSYQISALDNSGPAFFRMLMLLTALILKIYNFWLLLLEIIFKSTKKMLLVAFYFLFGMDYSFKGKIYYIINTSNFEYYLLVFYFLLILILILQFVM